MTSVHPVIYECDDFIFYLELWNGMRFIHLTIINFNHNIFKKMKDIVCLLTQNGVPLYGYGEENTTERLMKMAGFKKTGFAIINSNNIKGEILCLHQQL